MRKKFWEEAPLPQELPPCWWWRCNTSPVYIATEAANRNFGQGASPRPPPPAPAPKEMQAKRKRKAQTDDQRKSVGRRPAVGGLDVLVANWRLTRDSRERETRERPTTEVALRFGLWPWPLALARNSPKKQEKMRDGGRGGGRGGAKQLGFLF
jgi:hypothetical protein